MPQSLKRSDVAAPARLTHRSLQRGLAMLEAVAASGVAATLAELARRTGLHRSTAHHLLQTLAADGWLRQDPASKRYELAAKLFRLTGRVWTPEQLGEIAQPFLAELTRRTGEGSSFAAWRDGAVTIVAKHDPEGPVRVVQNVGAERPVHATAVGKAIAAFLPQPELTGTLDRLRFERHTAHTIMTRKALEAELARIRAQGFAPDDEEHLVGIRCLAAPVFGYSGVLGSLCALGPKSRMTQARLRNLRAPLVELARSLSERLDGAPG
jgi:IclR family acetate operon transcriptional repressor